MPKPLLRAVSKSEPWNWLVPPRVVKMAVAGRLNFALEPLVSTFTSFTVSMPGGRTGMELRSRLVSEAPSWRYSMPPIADAVHHGPVLQVLHAGRDVGDQVLDEPAAQRQLVHALALEHIAQRRGGGGDQGRHVGQHGDFAGGGVERQRGVDHRGLPGLQQQLRAPLRHAGEAHRDGVFARRTEGKM